MVVVMISWWFLLWQSCGYSVWWVFGPSGYGVVGFDSGLILFYEFDSHHGYGCSVWWVF